MAHVLSEDFHCEESHEPDLARELPEHFAMCIYIVSGFHLDSGLKGWQTLDFEE